MFYTKPYLESARASSSAQAGHKSNNTNVTKNTPNAYETKAPFLSPTPPGHVHGKSLSKFWAQAPGGTRRHPPAPEFFIAILNTVLSSCATLFHHLENVAEFFRAKFRILMPKADSDTFKSIPRRHFPEGWWRVNRNEICIYMQLPCGLSPPPCLLRSLFWRVEGSKKTNPQSNNNYQKRASKIDRKS